MNPPLERNLAGFTGTGYDRGGAIWKQVLWHSASHLVFQKWWFPRRLRPPLLRAFGATIGEGALIRQGVKIHWPWKLTLGANCWIGEDAWLLNLEDITIGDDVCVSQSALLCTGSHDRRSQTFEFDNGPIVIEDGVWIAARATVLRGVVVGTGAVIGATCLVSCDVDPHAVVRR